MSEPLQVVLAHEWLTNYAGSERCVEQWLAEFPDAQLHTTMLDAQRVPQVFHGARTTMLQRLPGARSHHEWVLPLMPAAWRLHRVRSGALALVSSSHACARAIRVPKGTPHVSYVHTPMRYAWEFDLEKERFPRWAHPAVRALMTAFRRWDRRKAADVDVFCANSADVAERIRRHYGRAARVVFPPVDTDFYTPGDDAPGEEFLFVGRFVAYKRPDLVVEAFRGLPEFRLRMVGGGPMEADLRARATPNITFLGGVSDEQLRAEYRRARAMIFCAHEDFGIVMAEAQACGTPVIALNRGGARDIVTHGVTGWLIADQDAEQLRTAVRTAAAVDLDRSLVAGSAQRFGRLRYRAEMRRALEDAIALRGNAIPRVPDRAAT